LDILYGQGISKSGDIIDLATDLGIIDKSGAWFSFSGERIGQGRENAKTYLEQHPQLMDKLEAMILTKHNIKGRTPEIQSDAKDAKDAKTEGSGSANKDGKDGKDKDGKEAKDARSQDGKARAEVAPDGKPVVRMSGPPKNGADD